VFLLIFNIYDVQSKEELIAGTEILIEVLSLTFGIVAAILLSVIYFFKTNVDVFKLKKRKEQKITSNSLVKSIFSKERYWFQPKPLQTYQPSYYFSSPFRISLARMSDHYDKRMVRDIFRQNHLNGTLFELIAVGSFLSIGLFQDIKLFMIPSGASILLLSTVLLMVVTIFYSWFKSWAFTLIIFSFFGLNYLSQSTGFLQARNQAFGLSYESQTNYNLNELKQIQFNEKTLDFDLKHHINILNNWHKKASKAQNTNKPKLIFVNCSGGGLRSAMWTHYVLQELDERSKGVFYESTHLVTGASGGMVGAAYYRDIYNTIGHVQSPAEREIYLKKISKDLLNNVAFNLASHDIFLRYRQVKMNGNTYLKDRGYAFEEQLNENTDYIMDNDLNYYAKPEYLAQIPLMVFTPTIINDGRRMVVAAQPYAFLNGLNFKNKEIGPENIEFTKLLKKNKPFDVRFTSVIRMNSTFPYILPMVSLPTTPEIHLMDAGIRDNYGTKTTLRYIMAFQNWIEENTSGLILIEIRDIKKDYDIMDEGDYSLFQRVVKPIGNFYGNYLHAQEYEADEMFDIARKYAVPFDRLSFVLRNDPTEKIALSWHLTQREKNDIRKTFQNEKNQKELEKLIDLLKL
jgi:hypothetical protein